MKFSLKLYIKKGWWGKILSKCLRTKAGLCDRFWRSCWRWVIKWYYGSQTAVVKVYGADCSEVRTLIQLRSWYKPWKCTGHSQSDSFDCKKTGISNTFVHMIVKRDLKLQCFRVKQLRAKFNIQNTEFHSHGFPVLNFLLLISQ